MTWYYSNNNERYGPVSAAELEQLVRSGVVTGDTLVWREGMTEWQTWRVVSAQMGAPSPAGGAAAPMYTLRTSSAPVPEALAGSAGPEGARPGAESGQPVEFEFSGSGGEYFRVWIVNVLLTIVTFGIYAAWAKVRTRRYFYAHTSFAGHAFEYLAEPKRILFGNLIVMGVFILFNLAAAISPALQVVFMLIIAVAVPWVIARSILFNARNSAWRGLRFGFGGNYGGAFFNFILLPVLVPFTLGLLFPYVVKRQREWLVENHRYGTTSFRFGGRTEDFYKIYLKALLFFLLPVVLGGVLASVSAVMTKNGGEPPMVLAVLIPVVIFACFFVGSAFLRASLFEYAWSRTHIGPHVFFSSMRTRDLAWLHLVNLVVTVVTLGLAWPWVAVRTARFQLSCLALIPGGSLDAFVGESQPAPGAVGEAAGDFLDFDIGFGV